MKMILVRLHQNLTDMSKISVQQNFENIIKSQIALKSNIPIRKLSTQFEVTDSYKIKYTNPKVIRTV